MIAGSGLGKGLLGLERQGLLDMESVADHLANMNQPVSVVAWTVTRHFCPVLSGPVRSLALNCPVRSGDKLTKLHDHDRSRREFRRHGAAGRFRILRTKTNIKMKHNLFRKLGALCVAVCSLASSHPCAGQQIQAGDTSIQLIAGRSSSNTQIEWDSVLRNNAKVRQMVAYAEGQFGGRVVPTPVAGFQTDITLRYSKGSNSTDLGVRTILIPLVTSGTRIPGGSAVLEACYYVNTPELLVPRLLIRVKANDWNATEYAFRKDGRVTEMSARFGDCLFRSSLKIIEERNGPAHRSLRSVLDRTAQPGRSLLDGMRAILDLREPSVGQRDLLLATGVICASNVEEEYADGYISGTLDRNFKPERGDSQIILQGKVLAKQVLKDLLKAFGAKLWNAIATLIGFAA